MKCDRVLAPGFGTVPTTFPAINLATTSTLADMDGDGRADLVYISGRTDMRVAISTGTGWTTSPLSYDMTPIGFTTDFHLEDLNREDVRTGLVNSLGWPMIRRSRARRGETADPST